MIDFGRSPFLVGSALVMLVRRARFELAIRSQVDKEAARVHLRDRILSPAPLAWLGNLRAVEL